MKTDSNPSSGCDIAARHFRWGWWSLLLFLSLGIALEAMHGFKMGFYLNPSNATRRLMWTLAHAHGTLFALVHLALAASVLHFTGWEARSRSLASLTLRGAGLLVPAGFFLGGVQFFKADPGLGILLVPPGALLLLVSVYLTARAASSPKAPK